MEVSKFVACYIAQERGSLELADYSKKLMANMRSLEILLRETEDKKQAYKRENISNKAFVTGVHAVHADLVQNSKLWQKKVAGITKIYTELEARVNERDQYFSCLEHELHQKTEEAAAGAQKIVDLTAQLERVLAQKEEDNISNHRRINELVEQSQRMYSVYEKSLGQAISATEASMGIFLDPVKQGLREVVSEMDSVTTELHDWRGEMTVLREELASVVSEKDELKRLYMMHTFQIVDQLALFGLSMGEFNKELRETVACVLGDIQALRRGFEDLQRAGAAMELDYQQRFVLAIMAVEDHFSTGFLAPVRKGLVSFTGETAMLVLELAESHATIEQAMQDTDSRLKKVSTGLGSIRRDIDDIAQEILSATSAVCEDMRKISSDNLALAGLGAALH